MNRRELLKLIASGAIGHTLDLDRLLWVPGAKKIFIPSSGISISSIISLELKRITPHLQMLFERDSAFYRAIGSRKVELISSRPMRIPLSLQLDDDFEDEI